MPRLVYSLLFETEREPGAEIIIVNLTPAGTCAGIRPIGKPRVVDLPPGDEFVHQPTQKQYKLAAMSAYRQHQVSEEDVASGSIPADGYLLPRLTDWNENPYAAPQCEAREARIAELEQLLPALYEHAEEAVELNS